MRYDTVLLDFDGTIADSMPSILVCIRYAMDTVGIPYTEEQLRLWEWIAAYYLCTPGEAMKAGLPGGIFYPDDSDEE